MNNLTGAITLTVIFRADALNRDEKLAGNIPSIKKLTRNNGKDVYSYLSRVAMRHYLYNTLWKSNAGEEGDWKATPCKSADVIQFDLEKANILEYAEIDAFGYMYTAVQPTFTRKAPVGITKAVALETWHGDMQFNANHDLVSRCNGATPNPVNKEEQQSYYKVSFTIDLDKLGRDEVVIQDYKYKTDESMLQLFYVDPKKAEKTILVNVELNEEGNTKIYKIKYKEKETDKEGEIKIEGEYCFVSTNLMNEKSKKLSFINDIAEEKKGDGNKKPSKQNDYSNDDYEKTEDGYWKFKLQKMPDYEKEKKELIFDSLIMHEIKDTQEKEKDKKYTVKDLGNIEIEEKNKIKKAIFTLDETKKQERVKQILSAIKNGLIYHSSGECPGIVSKFIIASKLKLPIPIFHSFVELDYFDNSILENEYIEKVFVSGNIRNGINADNIKQDIKKNNDNFVDDWKEFLKKIGIENNEKNTEN